MQDRIELALIYGSTREGRLCDKVARWAAARIEHDAAFSLDTIDPAALALPARHERASGAAVTALRGHIARADAFVVVTPEYNHSFPAALKFLIDSVYEEWRAKPAAFVSYGGASGGLRAVEQLRLVFAELHAVTVRDSVSLAHAWQQFDGDGRLRSPERPAQAMAKMLAQLHWWASALREARRIRPYGQAAA